MHCCFFGGFFGAFCFADPPPFSDGPQTEAVLRLQAEPQGRLLHDRQPDRAEHSPVRFVSHFLF